ncbi:MAG: hypothetical protein RAK18_07830, partial [Conexivisphaerales archaeon]|nr:hypothetical protein [Conexivisphaerales archaeon]
MITKKAEFYQSLEKTFANRRARKRSIHHMYGTASLNLLSRTLAALAGNSATVEALIYPISIWAICP